jgi:hypothetical protein
MKSKQQTGCQRQPNFDSHVGTDSENQEIVVFEPEQVLPVYRIAL